MEICFVGDIMLGRLVNDALRKRGKDAPAFPWGDTLPLLARADVRIGNLECVLADGGTPWPGKTFRFRSDRRNVACLEAAGFDAVSLANNHVLDYGDEALREMLPTLDLHGILHAGAGVDRESASRAALWECGAATLGFLAVTDNEPGWAATARAPGVHYVPIDPDAAEAKDLLEAVREVKARADLLVVSAHWGGNWGSEPPEGHRRFAHALVDAGADVVFGHSAHVVRGVEVYRGRPVIYSAGDFVDDYAVDPLERNDQSFVFLLRTEGGVPDALHLYPTLIEDFQARRARGSEGPRIARRMQELCRELGTRSRWLDEGTCLSIPLGGGG